MSTLSISIVKATVISEISLVTTYQAGRNKNVPEDFSRVNVSDADVSILDKYWNECIAEIDKELKMFITDNTTDDDEYAMSLTMPSNYDSAMDSSINTSLKTYVVNAILSKWFAITDPTSSERYATIAAGAMQSAKNKLWFRKKPTRTAIPNT